MESGIEIYQKKSTTEIIASALIEESGDDYAHPHLISSREGGSPVVCHGMTLGS